MFLLSKWNQTKTYEHAIDREFGTDYGICCWYTPQLNYTEIDVHRRKYELEEPHWELWFDERVKKVQIRLEQKYFKSFKKTNFHPFYLPLNVQFSRAPRPAKTMG